MYEEVICGIKEAVAFLKQQGRLEDGAMVVLGCSTSEVMGERIGKGSVPELGEHIAKAMVEACRENRLVPAFQCCEHLNRALVMDRDELRKRNLVQVHAVPQPKAGGSVPAAAWKLLSQPALALSVQADAAIDIGDTLVGMHIRPVAVPLRAAIQKIGHANLVLAYSRLPYTGGPRAMYE